MLVILGKDSADLSIYLKCECYWYIYKAPFFFAFSHLMASDYNYAKISQKDRVEIVSVVS